MKNKKQIESFIKKSEKLLDAFDEMRAAQTIDVMDAITLNSRILLELLKTQSQIQVEQPKGSKKIIIDNSSKVSELETIKKSHVVEEPKISKDKDPFNVDMPDFSDDLKKLAGDVNDGK